MLNERLRRVTDLFIEGTELYFGMDDEQKPIVMWVNKLNSFEVEEARRDAMVKRGLRVAELSKPDSPELAGIMASIESWDDQKLAERRVDQMSDELYLQVLNDIETEEGWREKVDMLRRGTSLLDDEGAPENDPRRQELTRVQQEYIAKVRAGQERKYRETLEDVKANSRQTNIDEFLEAWRNRDSLDIFMKERRVSELFAALRDCKATVQHGVNSDNAATMRFDHSDCDHRQRLLATRAEVYELPESVIERAGDAIDGITISARDAGNLDAPASSSASSERSSAEAAVSTPSIPIETPLAAPTT